MSYNRSMPTQFLLQVEVFIKGDVEREHCISSWSCHNSSTDETRIRFFSQTNQKQSLSQEHICTFLES